MGIQFSMPFQQTNQPKPKQSPFNIYINVISLSLAIAIKQAPELEVYQVVHPKKLHILHKREIKDNQTEKHAKEVSNENDCGIFQSS